MPLKTIYILHKNGAKSHYTALNYLLKSNKIELKHREFSVFSKLFKSITSLNFTLFIKQLINLGFLISLIFSKNKAIVLGIAPFDSKLLSLLKVLKNHNIYYHTSWTYWDKTFHPKKQKSEKVFKAWRYFLEEKTKHIFAVTNQSKNQLIQNYNLTSGKISVVYHALDEIFLKPSSDNRSKNSFVYLGRLVPQKGIEELLDVFSKSKSASLTIIGSGKEQYRVESSEKKYPNINYIPHISNKEDLLNELSKHEFLILNSKRNNKWEELFGLVIIESMAQGLIPIATKHSGPREIITPDIGYLYNENDLNTVINKIIDKGFDIKMSLAAKKKAQYYIPKNIAKHWQPILE